MRRWWTELAFLVFLFCGATWIFYGLFDRDPPRTEISAELTKPGFRRGEALAITWQVTWRRDCPGEAHRVLVSLVDEHWSYAIPDTGIMGTPPEVLPEPRVIHATPATVPWNMPLGKAYYQLSIDFRCRWIQWLWPIKVEYPVVPFEVLP